MPSTSTIVTAMIGALDTGANVPLVLAVQMSRLLLMVIVGPLIVRRLVRREGLR
jgi:uncharacterized membrane protein AbrB (regulator of aidB expression)